MRPSKDQHYICMAELTSQRATCARRKVGCVLVDDRGDLLSNGYNGVARGQVHCTSENCKGATCPSGQGLDMCEAIHAEANALLQCPNIYRIHTAYVTTAPCVHCIKLLMNTSCQRIVFKEDYPHSAESRRLWTEDTILNRKWECITDNTQYSFKI